MFKSSKKLLAQRIAMAVTMSASMYTAVPTTAFADEVRPAAVETVEPETSALQSDNSFTVNSTVNGYVLGGYTDSENINNNKIIIDTGATIGKNTKSNFDKTDLGYSHQDGLFTVFSVAGGYSENGDVLNNNITINGGTAESNIIGGVAFNGNATDNEVTVNDGTLKQDVVGGAALYEAKNNNVVLNGGSVGIAVIGGQGESLAESNSVTINGGTTAQVIGGYSYSGQANVSSNKVTINDGSVTGNVFGGQTKTGNADNNTVIVNGGTFGAHIIGGEITRTDLGTNTANNNNVIINSALQMNGYLYGGRDAQNGQTNQEFVQKGNKLTVNAKNVKVGGIYNFEDININLADVEAGDTAVTITNPDDGDTDLSNTNITVSGATDNNSSVTKGDTVKVIAKTDNGVLTVNTDNTKGIIQKGVSTEYDLTFENKDNTLTATVGDSHLTKQTAILPSVQVARSEMVNAGSVNIDSVLSAATNSEGDSKPWVTVTQQRGHFEKINNTNTVYSVGIAHSSQTGDSIKTVSPFIEVGHGDYTASYNNINGGGDTDMIGVGALYKTYDTSDGSYVEAAVRGGKIKGNFNSTSMAGSDRVSFENSGVYYAGQVKMGHIQQKGNNEYVDTYGGFYFSHTPSDSAEVSTGEMYDFDDINSARLRIGIRHNHDTNKGIQYVGAYVDQELANDKSAHFNGMSTDGSKLKGATGVIELGYRQNVDDTHKIGHDVSIKGYSSFGGWSAQKYGVQMQATVMGKF